MGGESLRRQNRGVSEKMDIFKVKNFPGEDFDESLAYFTSIITKGGSNGWIYR